MTILYLCSDSLTLAAILSKGCSLYSSKDRKVQSMDYEDDDNTDEEFMDGDDSDENFDGDYEEPQADHQLDDLLEQDLNWELNIARRKKKWKAKEDELRNEAAAKEKSTLHPDSNLKSHQPKQIFTQAAASGILINDLVSIMESAKVIISSEWTSSKHLNIVFIRKPTWRWTQKMITFTYGT